MPRRAKESAPQVEERGGCEVAAKPKRRSKKSPDEITSAASVSSSSEHSSEQPRATRNRKPRSTPAPDTRTEDTGCEDVPVSERLVCGFCGRSFKPESSELIRVEIHAKFDDKYLDMPGMDLCPSCVAHIPDYMAGAMHLGLRIPRENYTRKGFMYPPFQMCIERPAKAVKMSELVPWIKK